MLRILPVFALSLLLSGCALPVPVQVASWALDGILYLTTDKTMTDHGISAVVGEDCALLRGVKGDAVCRTAEEGVALAMADAEEIDFSSLTDDAGNPLPLAFEQRGSAPASVEELAQFSTAAGVADKTESAVFPEAIEQWDENFARTLDFAYEAPALPNAVADSVRLKVKPLEISQLPLSFEQDAGAYVPATEGVAALVRSRSHATVELAWDYVDASKGAVQ